ncbi:receptor like protein 22-like [Neltuma alba]|uniref:receptor like protein 22-like n=1 Tax=Neltuma alba TaxID=207710 RepID=UPI0010A33CBC|nr:receptor like protein 22-like [Prosopis alba]
MSDLRELVLDDIEMSSFAPGFSSLKSLNILSLEGCKFDGSIPTSFGNLTQLTDLKIAENNFSANFMLQGLRDSIFSFLNLSVLSLSSNNLRGPLSLHQFSKLQNLEYLDLSNNKFLSLSSDNNVHYILPNLTSLSLSSCNISDFTEVLGNLQILKFLNLSNNKIHGDIRQWFNNVGNGSLNTLDLSHNYLTSVEHLSMKNLTFLGLSFNLLQGNLPIPSFGAEFFLVSNNKFSGHISSSFCNASALEILNLSHNNLSGHLLECLVALPNLTSLDLQMNNFVRSIPDNFSKSNSLQSLHLNNNQFEGWLPLSLTHCKQLEILDVGANKINDKFTNWLEGLPKLQVLILRDNEFYGAIHSSNTKHPFPMLRIFDVSNNHFSGSLPTTYIKEFKGMMNVDFVSTIPDYLENNYGSRYYQELVMVTLKGVDLELIKILTTFTSIDMSKNMFDGKIPYVIGELHSLKGLNLSHNKITGPIPQFIANLTNLEWLDLSSNRLTGGIPLALVDLNFLEFLNLSQNQLVEEIPKGKQFDTFSQYSFEGNLGLCGFQLSKACNHDEGKLPQSTSSSNDKFGFGWKPVTLGYGCGMVFGIFMGQVIFLTGKPEGLVRIFQARPKKEAKRTRKRAHQNQRRVN